MNLSLPITTPPARLDVPTAERFPPDRHPMAVYLARLAPSSRRPMRAALQNAARLLTRGHLVAEEGPASPRTSTPDCAALGAGPQVCALNGESYLNGCALRPRGMLGARLYVIGGPAPRQHHPTGTWASPSHRPHAQRRRARPPLPGLCPGPQPCWPTRCRDARHSLRRWPQAYGTGQS